MNALWHIALLGRIALTRLDGGEPTGKPQTLRPGRYSALLVFLALRAGRTVTRQEIRDLLFEESHAKDPALRLRQELLTLRQLLEPPGIAPGSVLESEGEMLCLRPEAIRTDVQEFEQAVLNGEAAHALALWRGRLASGLEDEWLEDERLRYDTLHEILERTLPSLDRPVLHPEEWGDTEQQLLTLLALLPAGTFPMLLAEVTDRPDTLLSLNALRLAGWVEESEGRYRLAPWIPPEIQPTLKPRRRERALHRLLKAYARRVYTQPEITRPPELDNLCALTAALLPSVEAFQTYSSTVRSELVDALQATVGGLYCSARKAQARQLGDFALCLREYCTPLERLNLLCGIAHTRIENREEAQALFGECFAVAEQHEMQDTACGHLIGAGMASHHTERDRETLLLLEQALEFSRRFHLPSWESAALFELATSLAAQGRLDEAQQRFEEALAVPVPADKDNPVRRGVCLLRYGATLCELGETERARNAADEALTIMIPRDRRHEIADAERLLAHIALEEGRLGLARLHAQQARQDYAAIGNEGALIALDKILGHIALHEGDSEYARACFEKGLNYWRERGHRRWQAAFTLALAEWAIAAGEERQARKWKEETLALCVQTRAPHLQRKAEQLPIHG